LSKIYVDELDYLRAIAMLGVLGIHTGAFAIANPDVNIHFFGIVDILTRFSVPIFFFISAFGLFFGQDLSKPFHYAEFVQRRAHAVFYPYLAWSFIYILHQFYIDHDTTPFTVANLSKTLFFGLGSYQLYFLVILSWFYLLMPLWRHLMRIIIQQPVLYLFFLYILQNVLNYYSTIILQANTGTYWIDIILEYRLNYWVIHYMFIFLLGAVCGMLYSRFTAFITNYRMAIITIGTLSTIAMLGYYYHLVYAKGFSCEAAVNTLHQLHPLGIFYTVTTTLFLFALFRYILPKYPEHPLLMMLSALGANSYVIYLIHPLIMYYLGLWINAQQLALTVPVDIFYYMATAVLSFGFSVAIYRSKNYIPILSILSGSPVTTQIQMIERPNING
jgi:peptidoglycan/LPS O-acetylase OafA/YrhL